MPIEWRWNVEGRQRTRYLLLSALGWAYLTYAWAIDMPGIPGLGAGGVIVCPFRLLTGVPCPLCGTTRAWHAALHGEWSAAFQQHPVMPIVLPFAIVAVALMTSRVAMSALRSCSSLPEVVA